MFALEVLYLTSRAVATERHKREEAEWPPHPGRLFSALVDAAYGGVSTDGRELPDDIRDALEWLERQPFPALAVGDAGRREVIPVFVPVNDAAAPDVKPDKLPTASAGQIGDAVAVLPEKRGRQPRFFPTVIPDEPVVTFIWPDATPDDVARHRAALETLAGYVTYLGHSSSLVRVAVVDDAPEATLRPDPNGPVVLRVPAKGRLHDLVSHYNRKARPSPGLYAAYLKVGDEKPKADPPADPHFGDILVCELEGRTFLPLVGAVKLTTAVRDALIAHVERDADPAVKAAAKVLVSGHNADGSPNREVHAAVVPLANVGSNRHADGKVMGFGVVLPFKLNRYSAERRAVLSALAKVAHVWFRDDRLHAGDDDPAASYRWAVSIPTAEVPMSLRTEPYTRPAKVWATVTPVLCDRHPKEKDGQRIEDVIADSVQRVAGVRPVRVTAGPVSRHFGPPPSHAFDNRRKENMPPRHRVHVTVEFDRPVRGPIVAGAGRYAGLGLFRSVPEGRR